MQSERWFASNLPASAALYTLSLHDALPILMAPEADAPGSERRRQVTRPRPGHADLAGSLKYDRQDARDILERASARETVARVACGAVCKKLLREFSIEIGSYVAELGGVVANVGAQHAAPLPARINDAA